MCSYPPKYATVCYQPFYLSWSFVYLSILYWSMLMIFKDWHKSDQLHLICIQYWNRKQFYSCCAVSAMDHVLTGTLPSNYSQQPMRIKDSSAVHLSDVLLAVSKCLLHIIELVDKEWAHPWSEWAHPLSMNEHIPVSGFRVLSLPSAGNKLNEKDWN